jgi:hypothetical protein
MFEAYWKPYFDTWTQGVGDSLEKILRTPSTLRNISTVLHTSFKGKRVTDKTLYMLLTSIGMPSYRDQKKTLHMVQRLSMMLEDQEEKIEEQLGSLERRLITLQERLDTLPDMAQRLAQVETMLQEWLVDDEDDEAQEEAEDDTEEVDLAETLRTQWREDMTEQLSALDQKLEAITAQLASANTKKTPAKTTRKKQANK